MSTSPATSPVAHPGRAPASPERRLAVLGSALLVALPLAMWAANRSAPLFLGLAAAAFVAAALVAEGWRPLLGRLLAGIRSPIGLALSAFLLWSLVSLAWSHRPTQGLSVWGELVLPLLCGFAIAASGRFRPDMALNRALALAIIAASALIIFELASGLSQRILLGLGKQHGFVFNRPVLTCLVLAAAVLPGLWAPRAIWDRLLGVILVLAVVAVALVSDSGAAKLGLVILSGVWMLTRLAPRLALYGVIFGFTATMALAPVLGLLGDAAMPPALHKQLQESHTRERVDVWLSFGEAIRARPVRGAGFGTSAALDSHPVALAVSTPHRQMLAVGHPHSAPMQAWVETGVVGAATLAFAGLACLLRLRGLPARDLAPRLALFAAAFGVASVAHGAWQGWWIAALALAAAWLWAGLPRRMAGSDPARA